MKNIYKLPAYVGIILKKNNQVLLIQRHNTDWMSGYWNFPGGLLEENETLAMAAAQEIYEEVGVIIIPSDFIFSHILHVRNKNNQDIIGFYFITEKWTNTPINKEPDKHSNVGWFNLNNLPDYITEHALLAIDSIKNHAQYFENGW